MIQSFPVYFKIIRNFFTTQQGRHIFERRLKIASKDKHLYLGSFVKVNEVMN